MNIFLIDGIGPFFRGYRKQKINWSKIPFHRLHMEEHKRRSQFDLIAQDMARFAAAAKKAGYNSISLDDVAHLATDPLHPTRINDLITILQDEFRLLFSIINQHGLDIYLTMDVLSFTPALKKLIGGSRKDAMHFLSRQVESIFTSFQEVKGLIVRVGECDGRDVRGEFKSELFLRTPKQVNVLLRKLLPIFERYNRTLILRNWTVGAYRIGDFLWHRQTTEKVLKGIESSNFILSMKYGESDFFRYLPLNKNFFRFKVLKLIELQARREYEGCGEYPSFIGWEYQEYARQLQSAENVAGISVWCQTGGWVPFNRLTYLEHKGLWNELNSYVTLKLFKDSLSVEEAVCCYCAEKGIKDSSAFLSFLRLNHEVIRELLYIREVANLKLFFRRVRIPPLLSVFWNNIFINHSVRKILLSLVDSPEECVEEGYLALEKIDRMQKLAVDLCLPADDLEYMKDTFHILALAREYYFLPYNLQIRKQIKNAKRIYKQKYPKSIRPRYRIKTNYTPFSLRRSHINLLFKMTLRNKRGYRVLDYLFTLRLLGVIYRLLVLARPNAVPKFARKHAMGIDAIFR